MYQQPRMGSTAEARQAERANCVPHGLYDSGDWHDHAADDDEVYLAAVESFLTREAGEPQKPIAQIFRLCNARNEGIRHDSRFDKLKSHGDVLPAGRVLAFSRSKSTSDDYTALSATVHSQYSDKAVQHGFQSVNTSLRSTGERLAQIADQSPRHAIRQDNTRDNAVLVGMGDPGYQPHVSVDHLDVHASGEGVGNHQRFGQGRLVCLVGHRSSQFSGAAS